MCTARLSSGYNKEIMIGRWTGSRWMLFLSAYYWLNFGEALKMTGGWVEPLPLLPIHRASMRNIVCTNTQPLSTPSHVERKLGDSELSYFLPSRESGVNDMYVTNEIIFKKLLLTSHCRYLHLGFRAPSHLVERSHVSLVWAIMRVRHPLLASKVKMNEYDDVRFM